MSIKVIFTTILLLLASNSYAINCKLAKLSAIDKIICAHSWLERLDGQFNEHYKTMLDKMPVDDDKSTFKKSIKELLVARDQCLNVYGLLGKSKEMANVGVIDSEIYKISPKALKNGCLLTWYNTVNFALESNINNSSPFLIPTKESYADNFKDLIALHEYPYDFEVSNRGKVKHKNVKEFSEKIIYTFYFSKNNDTIIKGYRTSWYYFGHMAHGNGNSGEWLSYLRGNKDERVIPSDLSSGSYMCAVPISDPQMLNGQIYIPQELSFSTKFNKIFGDISSFRPYVATGDYVADCLLSLEPLNKGIKGNYLAFHDEYFDLSEDDLPVKFDKECAIAAIKKYEVPLENFGYLSRGDNKFSEKLILVNESSVEAIRGEWQSKCLIAKPQPAEVKPMTSKE